jgi:hypothetical protein
MSWVTPSRIASLAQAGARFSKTADELNELVAAACQLFNEHAPRVYGYVDFEAGTEQLQLGWAKPKGCDWVLVVRPAMGDQTPTFLDNAPLKVRAAAVRKIPALMDLIVAQAEEITGSIRASIDDLTEEPTDGNG